VRTTFLSSGHLALVTARFILQEICHWNRGIALLSKKLSSPLHLSDRDAVWASASILGVITFASIEATTPDQAWPPAASTSLEWLKMGQGKLALWRLVRPDRPDSIFLVLLSRIPDISAALEGVPPEVLDLFDLFDLHGGGSNNPYALPLAGIFPSQASGRSSDIGQFYAMNGWMLGEFGQLVTASDPRVLVLMAHWYAESWSHGQWWIRARALMEGQATCLYLEMCFPHIAVIQNLLKGPRQCLADHDLVGRDGSHARVPFTP
jgi:hypothetical protein